MAGSLNQVTLIGNLGQDPESRDFANGGSVVNLSIATSQSWKDRDSGERKERTEWHRVAIFNEPLGKVAKQYLKKGSKVYLQGQLETRKWQDQEGNDKYSTEVVLRPFNSTLIMLDGKPAEGGGRGGDRDDYNQDRDSGTGGFGGGGTTRQRQQSRPQPAAFDTDLDDDVPF